jgi:hypothetical protein
MTTVYVCPDRFIAVATIVTSVSVETSSGEWVSETTRGCSPGRNTVVTGEGEMVVAGTSGPSGDTVESTGGAKARVVVVASAAVVDGDSMAAVVLELMAVVDEGDAVVDEPMPDTVDEAALGCVDEGADEDFFEPNDDIPTASAAHDRKMAAPNTRTAFAVCICAIYKSYDDTHSQRCAKLTIVRRWRLLASPMFTGMVFLLALNDQVLKSRYPGFITGKLSDFAGVAVIAIALGSVVSARAACALAGVTFAALKTSHAVAGAIAPFLGGTTRTDPSDLVALAILLPVYRWLSGVHPPTQTTLSFRALLLPLALVSMVGATTATSCDGDQGIIAFHQGPDGSIEALKSIHEYQPTERTFFGVVARSTDGATWQSGGNDDVVPQPLTSQPCTTDGRCFRVLDNSRVEERAAGGSGWTTSFSFTAEQNRRMARRVMNMCSVAYDHLFESVTVVRAGQTEVVLVAMGGQGALVRRGPGAWQRVAVPTEYENYKPLSTRWPRWMEQLALSPFALVGVWPVLRRKRMWQGRLRRTRDGTAMAFVAMVVLGFVWAGLMWFVIDYALRGPIVLALSAGAFAMSVVAGLTPYGARLFRKRRKPPWPAPDPQRWIPPNPRP